jgi:flagellar FliJ protein
MQSILELKEKLEGQAKMEFAAAQMQLRIEQDKLNNLIEKRKMYQEICCTLQQKEVLNIPDILSYRDYIDICDILINEQKKVVDKAYKVVENARKKLALVMQERKMQEKLKEKAFEQFLLEERDAENKETDQRSSFAYGQRIKNGQSRRS